MPWQALGEWKAALGVIAGAALGALGFWKKASKTRADASGDALTVAENASKREWIEDRDAAVAAERRLREAAEARERELFALQQRTEAALRLCAADRERQDRRYRRLVDLLSETRPELREWLLTGPAGLDDTKGPTHG